MAHPLSWEEADEKLKKLFTNCKERGRVRAKLLDLEEPKQLKYFGDDDEAVKEGLVCLAGLPSSTPNESSGGAQLQGDQAGSMSYARTWEEANEELKKLFTNSRERGRVRAKLLDLDELKRLKYFQDDEGAVKEGLACFAGLPSSTFGKSSGGAELLEYQAGGRFDTVVDFVGVEGEGIKERYKSGFFTPRVQTTHKILKQAQRKCVVVLAGTPRSGKTSLCQLVCSEAGMSTVYEKVYYVNCAEVGKGGKSFEDVFLEQAGTAFAQASSSPTNSPVKQVQPSSSTSSSSSLQLPLRKKKLIVLDEAQTTYDTNAPGHELLWPLLKKSLASGGVNFLISTSRGSNPSAEGLPTTPMDLSKDQRIPLRPRPQFATPPFSDHPEAAEPALQFTMAEYEQLWESFCKRIGFSGDQAQIRTLFDVIEATTERHPGSVLHILDNLRNHQNTANFTRHADEWAAKEVEFVTSVRILDTLSGTRSFPTVEKFWNDGVALNLISELVASGGKKHLGELRRDSEELARKAEQLARSGYLLLDQDEVAFTSGLHMEFYRYNLTRKRWRAPREMPPTIELFLPHALSKMCPSALQHSLTLSIQRGAVGRVLESHFQFELYSSITSLVPEGVYLSPTVGKIYGLDAYVDFVLHGQGRNWAFELLIDGRDLTEHKRRFLPTGRYHPMVQGQLDAWIVMDMRNPSTGPPRRAHGQGVCHVFFGHKYELATIDFGGGNEQQVRLTGRA